jgi:ribose/xylose/arabinose/galactoside ABC-type transport system permease subunit
MKKTFGILGLLIVVFLVTAYMADSFLTPFNLENLIRRTSLFGIISIGVAFVIITGGIDLSIGSVVCLIGCGLPFLLHVDYQPNHQATLSEINSSKATITLNAPAGFSSGDQVRLYDSTAQNSGIYTVKNSKGTSITLDPAPANDDQRGHIVQVFPIEQRDNENKSITTSAGLNPRDQVTFVKANGDVGLTTRVLHATGNDYSLHEASPDEANYILALHRLQRTSVPVALTLVFLFSLGIGLSHGFMVAKIKLQPFVVTLCGLLLYRGITRGFTEDQTQGFQAEYPDLRLIATAKLGQLDYAQALGLFGGIIIAAGIGWLLWQRKKNAPANERRWPIAPIALGVGIALCGLWQAKHIPVIDAPVQETTAVKVDLPLGAQKISLEASDSSGWQQLDQQDIPPHDRPQQATVPSLATIKEVKAGDWNAVRIVVTQRELPRIGIPAPCLILIAVSVAAGIFLNHTIYGRYLLALGRNEEAAKYSGINTDRMIMLAYVICSLLAGLGGMLFVMDVNSAQPVDFGNFYELYAIAAAVLGGCSLRGGEGTILGVIIGACLMRVLKNMITLVDAIPTHIEYAIIGAVILAGVTVDELIKRYAAKRAAKQQDAG